MKKEVAFIVTIFLIIFIVPAVYGGILDFFKGGVESITGRDAITATISVGNTAPNISDVSLAALSFSPSEGDVRLVEVAFLANDAEGASNLDNTTAKVNISYQSLTGAGILTDSNSSCTSTNVDSDTNNYTCEINMQYFWDHSTAWTVDAEVKDNNNNFALNSSNQAGDGLNWTYSELIAANLTGTSLAWASVVPADTNASSTTNLTLENTGNSLSLNIVDTVIDLGGPSGTIIPAGNFSLFNITNTDKIECDFENQSAAVTIGAHPIVGVNETAIRHLINALKRGGGSDNFGLTNVCLFDVPADLLAGTYDTSSGGTWTIVEEDSGE